jgi:hypothetical protein
VALAAIEWEILMSAQQEAKQKISSDDLLEIRYKDLCQDPIKSFRTAIEFSDLEWSPTFEATIRGFSFKNTNYKWREHLNNEQQKVLNECLSHTLKEYEYI